MKMLWQKQEKEDVLPTIASVSALDGDCFDVTLSNGHVILLELKDRIDEPAFADVIRTGLFDRPQTDGNRLYWIGGPSIALPEIFSMVMSHERQTNTKTSKPYDTFSDDERKKIL